MINQTTVRTYPNEYLMQKGIQNMAAFGWNATNVTCRNEGYKAGKTCCLGLIFLPLALLGKNKDSFIVSFQRQITERQVRIEAEKVRKDQLLKVSLMAFGIGTFVFFCVIVPVVYSAFGG